jgi:predicted anti-sigma-YlaC factor YlaD
MLTPLPPSECERARAAVSLRLDGELSELERAWLDGHLVGCADCRFYEVGVAGFTGRLRATPLERPSVAMILPRRRRTPVAALAAAACVLAAAASSATLGLGRAFGSHHAPPAATISLSVVHDSDLAEQHLLGLFNSFSPTPIQGGRLFVV